MNFTVDTADATTSRGVTRLECGVAMETRDVTIPSMPSCCWVKRG